MCITNLEEVSSWQEVRNANLVEKRSLDTLQLTWVYRVHESRSTSQLDRDVLDGLRPHLKLKRLTILNYTGSDFPYWMQDLTDQVVVNIINCRWLEVLPRLGELPNIKSLSLFGLSSVTHINDEVYGTNDVIFPYLEELSFSELFSWEQWSEAEYKLLIPHLRKLCINTCNKFSVLPVETLSSSVKELQLSACTSYISMLPAYLQRLTALTKFNIQDCSATILVPCHSLTVLESLHVESCLDVHFEGGLQYFTKLKKLGVQGCFDVTQNIYEQTSLVESYSQTSLLEGLQSLIHLSIDGRFVYFGYYHMLGRLRSLRTLKLCDFDLSQFTMEDEEWLDQLQSLQEIQFSSCRSLLHLPSNLNNMFNLRKIIMNDCCKLHSLPLNGLPDDLKNFISPEVRVYRRSQNLVTSWAQW